MEEFCNGGPNPCRGKDCVDKDRGGVKYDPSGPRIQGWDEMKAMCVTAYYVSRRHRSLSAAYHGSCGRLGESLTSRSAAAQPEPLISRSASASPQVPDDGCCRQDVPWLVYTPKQDKGSILFTGSQPANYTTSLIGNWTVDFIKRHAAAARSGSPFFVSAATRAPHAPQTPAPWYADALPEVKNLIDRPDFNFTSSAATKAAGAGHASYIEAEPPVTAAEAVTFDNEFRDRWRTLMSVSPSCPTAFVASWLVLCTSMATSDRAICRLYSHLSCHIQHNR